MASTKLIAVIGATGTQGGSVVRAFLNEPGCVFEGVEVVQADLDDPSSLDRAFAGATAIFSMTEWGSTFFNPEARAKKSPDQKITEWAYEYELRWGKNVFDAAAKVKTLERLVFSSLSDISKWSGGKYTQAFYWDAKAHAVAYGQETYPKLWEKTSIIQIGFYLSNALNNPMFQPRKNAEGVYQFISNLNPNLPLPFTDAEEDTGVAVKALVQLPAGKNLLSTRESIGYGTFVKLWGQILNVPAEHVKVSNDQLAAGMPEGLGSVLSEVGSFYNEFGATGNDPTVVYPDQLEVAIKMPSVESWIKEQDWSKVL